MLYFITGNNDKFKEVKNFLDVKRLDLDLEEIQEIDAKKVIEAKLKEAKKNHEGDFIIEDISLYFDCLNGMPGPLIKWYLKTIGNEGLFKICKGFNNYNCEAKAIFGLMKKGKISFFEGSLKGKIVEPRGKNGFGWDQVFMPKGFNKTFAEMTDKEKNSISMRKIALEKLKLFLDK